MTTTMLPDPNHLACLIRRGWTVTDFRHGWDASCVHCDCAVNAATTELLRAACDAHDAESHQAG